MSRIREGRPDDLPRLRAIQAATLAEPWPELLEAATDGPPALYVVCEDRPVGYAAVVGGPDGVAYVPELAVHPARQDRGLGSRLMDWLCDRLAADGYRKLRLTARAGDERARRFYREHDFEKLDRLPDHFENGDGVVLARPLD